MNPSKRSILIVGAGAITRLGHVSSIPLLPDTADCHVAVADPNSSARTEFAKLFPTVELFDDYRAMLISRPAASHDIVVVATPPFAHREICLAGFASGRHVLCEKPLGMSRAEGVELLAAARRAGKLLGCCSTRVAGSAVTAKARELVQSDRLGEVYHATMVIRRARSRPGIEGQPTSRWFIDRSKSGGGPVADWGPYEFATMSDALTPTKIEVLHAWLARPETEIDPKDCVYDVEHHAAATLKYHVPGRAPVAVDYERAFCTHGDETASDPITFQIEGTKGAVKWEWITDGNGRLWHSFDRAGKRVTELLDVPAADNVGMHHKPLVYFDRAVRGAASPAYVNKQALFNFEILHAIYDYAATGQRQVVERGI